MHVCEKKIKAFARGEAKQRENYTIIAWDIYNFKMIPESNKRSFYVIIDYIVVVFLCI